ncbi:MAG: putative DNA binding domain-containing protein [Desulfovibrio sp.]|jgi:ATP-dependent DNA helicase RecG|nr:putative DNA binding domain-containing protein [Desulfovibrio sp.]
MNWEGYRIRELIENSEGIDVEFIPCRNSVSDSVYETICAFLNRYGGTILLGVQDDGTVEGVDPNAIENIHKEFIDVVSSPLKIFPPIRLPIDEFVFEEKKILRIFVPAGDQVYQCNGRIYDRHENLDLDITKDVDKLTLLFKRKQSESNLNEILPHLTLDDIERDWIQPCQNMASVYWEGHPWKGMGELQFLKSAQLYGTDPSTHKEGLRLAAILLLGKRSTLQNLIPHHSTDLIFRKVNIDHYDDRDLVDVNLLESYDRIMTFVKKHLPSPFYLEGIASISLRDKIFREIASNILIHRDYASNFPAKIIIEYGKVTAENASASGQSGRIDVKDCTPIPKNPLLAHFFRQIGRADALGSGLWNLKKYCVPYGGADAELMEGDIFRTIVKVPEFNSIEAYRQARGPTKVDA